MINLQLLEINYNVSQLRSICKYYNQRRSGNKTQLIQEQLKKWIDSQEVDVVIATGGTGVTGRDITPEAFEELYDKAIPGFGELFRMLSYQNIKTSTLQSRCTGGVTNGTFLFALPGSTGACKDGWDQILIHQLDSTHKPCNLVELMPRLLE